MQNEIVAHNDLKIRVHEEFFASIESKKLAASFIENLHWESMRIQNVWQRCCDSEIAMLGWRCGL